MPEILLIKDSGQSEVVDYDAICKFQEDNQTERLPDPIPRIPLDRKGIRFRLKELRKEGYEVKYLDKRRFMFAKHATTYQARLEYMQLSQAGLDNLVLTMSALKDLNEAEQTIFQE